MGKGNLETYEYLIVELYRSKWSDDTLTFRDILKRLHIDEGISYRKLASMFKVAPSTIYMWLKRECVNDRKMKW